MPKFFDKLGDAFKTGVEEAKEAAGGVAQAVRERAGGPSTFTEALDDLVATWRARGKPDKEIKAALHVKADSL